MNLKDKTLLSQIARVSFYLAIIIEIAIVIIDKSDYTNPITGRLFQLTFCLFALKICFTKYTKKEWIVLFGFLLLGVISYRITGRNEIIRITSLVFACKEINMKHCMKLIFWMTTVGCMILVALSITGIFGTYGITMDFGRGVVETRYALGLGHPNALHCMAWALILLGTYVYKEVLKVWQLALIMLGNIGLYFLTDSRTSTLMITFTLVIMAVALQMKYKVIHLLLYMGTIDSMVGAITRGAEEGYFDYLGKSITIDAVSLYASLVRRMKMPYGRPRVVSWESFCYAKEAKTALHLIRFSVTRATAKNLAWRGKEHFNNILYPEVFLGETFNMWCFELDLFKETYDLQGVRVIEILQFKAAANMFNKEIDFLFKKKEENKLYKPMLNGAFGRFSKDPKSSAVFDYPSYQEGEKEFIKVDNSDTYLAFFSCLLAYGRVELVSTIFKLGVENFLYSDTDSITFKGEIPSHFKTGDNLGDWKIESHNTYFRHLKAKTYMKTTENGDVFKASGFSAEAMEEVTKENFMLGTKLVDYEWYMNGIIPKLKKRSKYLGGEEYRQNEKFNIDEDLYPVLDKQLYEGKYINVASFINQFDDETREEMLRNLKFDISHIS